MKYTAMELPDRFRRKSAFIFPIFEPEQADLLVDGVCSELCVFPSNKNRRDEELMRGCFHPDAEIELHEALKVETAFPALRQQCLRDMFSTPVPFSFEPRVIQ